MIAIDFTLLENLDYMKANGIFWSVIRNGHTGQLTNADQTKHQGRPLKDNWLWVEHDEDPREGYGMPEADIVLPNAGDREGYNIYLYKLSD